MSGRDLLKARQQLLTAVPEGKRRGDGATVFEDIVNPRRTALSMPFAVLGLPCPGEGDVGVAGSPVQLPTKMITIVA